MSYIPTTPSATSIKIEDQYCKKFDPVYGQLRGMTELDLFVQNKNYSIFNDSNEDLYYHVDFGDEERIYNKNLETKGGEAQKTLLHQYEQEGIFRAKLYLEDKKYKYMECANVDVYIQEPVIERCSELHIQSDNIQNDNTIVDYSITQHEIEKKCENLSSAQIHIQVNSNEVIQDLGKNNIEIGNRGPAQVDHSQTLFGESTLFFDKDQFVFFETDHLSSNDWTIEFWIKYNTEITTSTKDGITARFDTTADRNTEFSIGLENDKLRLVNNLGAIYTDIGMVDVLNSWTHLAAVRNGSLISLYVNGKEEANMTTDGEIKSSSQPIILGAVQHHPVDYWEAVPKHIQDYRISEEALYTENFTPPETLLTNSSIFHTEKEKPYRKSSIRFKSCGLEIKNSKNNFNFINSIFESNWSIEASFNLIEKKDINPIINNVLNEGDVGFDLGIYNNSLEFFISTPNEEVPTQKLSTFDVVEINTWYHVKVIKNNDYIYLYLDGEEKDKKQVYRENFREVENSQNIFIGTKKNFVIRDAIIEPAINAYIQDLRITKKVEYTQEDFKKNTDIIPSNCSSV